MEWKWSIGEPYQKSARKIKTIDDDIKNIEMKPDIKAYDLSLNQDEYNWDSINDVQHFTPEQFKVTNKRESKEGLKFIKSIENFSDLPSFRK